MDPRSLIPAPDVLPAPVWTFDVLLLATFVLHVLAMNVLVGGSVIALVAHVRGRGLDVAQDLSRRLPTTLALTINFGVAPLLFLQVLYGHLVYASSLLMAGFWLGMVFIVLAAYYALYLYDFRLASRGEGARVWLWVALALLLCAGFLFSNNMTLMLRLEAWPGLVAGQTGWALNLSDPTLIPRWLHFMTAALAVGGLAVALLGRRHRHEDWVELGMLWFTRATLAQLAFGTWFLLSLPRPVMLAFMGDHVPATMLLLAGLAAAGLSLAAGFQKKPVPAAVLTVLTVALMALVRDQVRALSLKPWFSLSELQVATQVSPIVLFLATFAVGLIAVAWMLKAYARAGRGV
jgi:hypothetical protein